MDKNKKPISSMTEDELKLLKKSIEYVKKLNIFNDNKESKLKKIKRVA